MKFWSGVLVAAVVVGSAIGAAPARAQWDYVKELQGRCEKGDLQACENLGGSLELGFSQPTDLVGARRAYEMGCKGKEFSGLGACVQLYRMVSLGEGGPKDAIRAAELKDRACNTRIIAYEAQLERAGLCKD